MSGDASVSPPAVLWAQRNSTIFLSICLEDCRDPVLQINPSNIYFRGVGGTERKEHEVNIELYKDIVPELSKQFQTGRTIELILKKKEEGPYWPQLTKLKQRYHWLKINFNKWKEEDDSDVEEEENFEDMIRSIGDLGTGSRPSFENDTDSDDNDKDAEDDLPPLE
ncbi:prostaglandin E synthase 3 [Planococcus citri]|uniref:prostaglandin E synthase 3 n=1 Tax=Planococcus citri TaxID=170843 RepID=UPI0031FA2770